MNCSQSLVQKIVKKYIKTGDVVDKKKSGCSKKLIPHNEQFLKVSRLQNHKKVSAELVQHLRKAN